MESNLPSNFDLRADEDDDKNYDDDDYEDDDNEYLDAEESQQISH